MLNYKKVIFFLLLFLFLLGGVFYFRHQVYYSHGNFSEEKNFEVKKGEGNADIADNLQKSGLIFNKIYFYYYLRSHSLTNKIMPGVYRLSGNLTIPEIANVITQPDAGFVKITFPEGWTAKKMAERLSDNGLDGEAFLELVSKPEIFQDKYDFLNESVVKTLEGYLFPDTYFFKKDEDSYNIVSKMLNNFQGRIANNIEGIKNGKKTLREIIIMASIIEMEVRSEDDRKVVSGIFWDRISFGMPIQSDITLTYALGVKKKQYSIEDTQFDSPYNTYRNRGLPPGPIGNPGEMSIEAAVHPRKTDYIYFLSDPSTGETVFAKTLEEHIKNKSDHGL